MTAPFTLHLGDCVEVMRTLPDNSVDAIVCDPPYGLNAEPDMAEVLRHWLAGDDYKHKGGGFMGKSWDSFVPGPSVWREALRVLKPGGHLLAFFGTRTQDIGTLAIRLAGFEIRDCIDRWYDGAEDGQLFLDSLDQAQRDAFMRLQDQGDARLSWGYGSGFPKSQNISKAIDKQAGAEREVVGTSDSRGRDGANRQTLASKSEGYGFSQKGGLVETASATDAARQWEGWGTALKPAHEPVCVARKPLAKSLTIAANVLQFGTGAINIDGCRVPTEDKLSGGHGSAGQQMSGGWERPWMKDPEAVAANAERARQAQEKAEALGRWPANIIHDGSDEVVALFPAEAGASAPVRGTESSAASVGRVTGERARVEGVFHGDSGSAARFFYCAKASSKDRGEDNVHPTVKPTDLMAYLVRLVTPPGGLVLDPFMGSGSTGKACMREGFQFTGIDMTPDYVEIARQRIEHELARVIAANTPPPPAPQLDLFAMPTGEGDANAA